MGSSCGGGTLPYSPLFRRSIPPRNHHCSFCSLPHSAAPSLSDHALTREFSWDDVVNISNSDSDRRGPSALRGFFEKVKLCNRNAEKQSEFIPFVIERSVVGYVHNGFAQHLRTYKDVFTFPNDGSYGGNFGYHLTLHPLLGTSVDRTKAVDQIIKSLGDEVIPGIRNEFYPVMSSFGTPEFFSLERAAAPYFGIKGFLNGRVILHAQAYGVHINGYVERGDQKYIWVGKRSKVKPTYPGKLDHLVAGGLPYGISCAENLVKECEEEAGIPRSISSRATAVGAVSYMDIEGHRLKRDVLFCYDLKLPEDFVPANKDGEVESFKLLPLTHVADIIRCTEYYKANCNLVIIDFLFRHGYINPDDSGYLKLLQSLRNGDCT